MQSCETEINGTIFFLDQDIISLIIRFEFLGDQYHRTHLSIANLTIYNFELFSGDSGYLTYITAFNLLQIDQCA